MDFFSVSDVDLAEGEMGWMDLYVEASNGSCRVDISNQLLGTPSPTPPTSSSISSY